MNKIQNNSNNGCNWNYFFKNGKKIEKIFLDSKQMNNHSVHKSRIQCIMILNKSIRKVIYQIITSLMHGKFQNNGKMKKSILKNKWNRSRVQCQKMILVQKRIIKNKWNRSRVQCQKMILVQERCIIFKLDAIVSMVPNSNCT